MSSSQISYKRYKEALEFHFAPILRFFSDKQITDIESNDDGNIYAHHIDGSSELLPVHLQPESIAAVAALLAAKGQNDITDDNPSVSAVWPDPPYRIEIVLPKAVKRPCMVIRRFAQIVYPLEHFIENGTLTVEMAKTIKDLIIRKKNIVISGETGSGKTTLMNTLLKEIPTGDRLFIIEDTRELQCSAPNKVPVLTGDNYTARKAIKNALRFRPDRIIVGEVRDGAALDLLEAWNTGHPGGMCSIHANNPDTVKLRLRSLIQQVSVSPQSDLIDATVDAVIQVTLCPDGKRRVTEIKIFNE